MKRICLLILFQMTLYTTLCFADDGGQGGIDWESRTRVDPVTGSMTIRTGERTASELNRAGTQPKQETGTSAPKVKTRTKAKEFINLRTGERTLGIGDGIYINPVTGERILDHGSGEAYNIDTGERIQYMGDEERTDVRTGDQTIFQK